MSYETANAKNSMIRKLKKKENQDVEQFLINADAPIKLHLNKKQWTFELCDAVTCNLYALIVFV